MADKSISYQPIHQELFFSNLLLSDVERTEEKRLFEQDKVSGYFNNWLAEFRQSKNPIREWATLFWHEHLPCTGRGQSNTFLLEQNCLTWELYRKNALGNLRQLLVDYYQNPAAMYFLDIHRSYKEGPSQNCLGNYLNYIP